ncbi:MAG: peptidoglycan editing factor PgeF [Oscillospiraceae bacterium]
MEFSKPFSEYSFKGTVYMTAPSISCTHCFTTRWGGVSEGIFDSLNLGENRGDSQENVRENYARLLAAMELPAQNLCFTRQVHKNDVRVVTSADRRELFSPFLYEADGIVTSEKNLPLICFSADCVPVLLCDDEFGVIGAIHCGWRSTVADILGVAVKKMISLGSLPRDIHAAIGPAIDMCCYETDGEVPKAISALLGGDSAGCFFQVGDSEKFMVDLKETNRRRLLQLGLLDENIAVSDECTSCCSDKYWSHRQSNGERGSQAAIICMVPKAEETIGAPEL